MNMKVKQTLDCIIQRFKTGDIPKAVAFSMFPTANIPSAKWSKLNRTIMFVSGTYDARGFKQWKEVGRIVKKNSTAIYILVPNLKKTIDKGTGKEEKTLVGFLTRPVFKMEDTEGKPLKYDQVELPELPLTDCAEKWGISIKTVPGHYFSYGYYSPKQKEIALASTDELNFFHELAHCSHEKVIGQLALGQEPFQEIVAELSAQALCCLVGKSSKVTIGNSYKYIERYADKLNMSVYNACLKVMRETEQVLMLILRTSQQTKNNHKKLK